MTVLLVVELDRAGAAELAVALRNHRQLAAGRDGRRAVAAGLVELHEACLRLVAIGSEGVGEGPDGSMLDGGGGGQEGEPRLLLSIEETARMLQVSKSTIKRQIRTGQLPSRVVGKRRLLHRDDVAAYAKGSSRA